jgi:hypothetical protein
MTKAFAPFAVVLAAVLMLTACADGGWWGRDHDHDHDNHLVGAQSTHPGP